MHPLNFLFCSCIDLRVFWLNIVKFVVYLRYRYCFKLFRKRVNFSSGVAEIQQKYEREREKVREKILNFRNHITEIIAAQTCWPTGCEVCSKCEVPKGNQLWKCLCRNRGKKICGNAIAENGGKKIVVAEIWEGILKKKVLCPQYFYNIFTINHR